MEEKVQLLHPAGKKLARIDQAKYDPLRIAILDALSGGRELTHTELQAVVVDRFKSHRIPFTGSLAWYLEGVKLDLEARGLVVRQRRAGKLLFRTT